MGASRGLVDEIVSFISIIATTFSIALVVMAIKSLLEGNIIDFLIATIMTLIVAIILKVIKVVVLPAQLLAKLPVIHGVDKILGLILGILEAIAIMWALFSFIAAFGMGVWGDQIMLTVNGNGFLKYLYNHNYLVVLSQILSQKTAESI